MKSTRAAAQEAAHERTSALGSGSFPAHVQHCHEPLAHAFHSGLVAGSFSLQLGVLLSSRDASLLTRAVFSLPQDGEGGEAGAHPLLRRSQSYIPPSATKPPAGPASLKSGFCVKQGNVVSAGHGLGLLQGCSGCRTSAERGRAEH